MPRASDDYWYAFDFHDYLEGITQDYPWREIVDTWKRHYTGDNIRLANVLLPFLLLAPKWLAALIPPLCMIAAARMMCAPWGFSRRMIPAQMLLMFLLVFLLPWHEYLFTFCYSMNYVVTSLPAVLFVLAVVNPRRHFVIGLASGVAVGFLHEGFGVALLCASATVALLWAREDRELRLRRLALCLSLVPGLIFLLTAPGVARNFTARTDVFSPHGILRVLKLHIPFFLFTALWILALARRRWRQRAISPLGVIIVVASVVAIAMHVRYPRGYRTAWVAYLLCVWGLVWLYTFMTPARWHTLTWRGGSIAAILLAVLVWHYAVVVKYARVARDVHDSVERQYLANPSATAYADILTVERLPLIAWRSPQSNSWNEWERWCFTMYHTGSDDRTQPVVNVVPEAMRTLSPLSGHLVPGSVEAREMDGYYFFRRPYMRDGEVLFTRHGSLRKMCYFYHTPFRDINGEEWVFAVPQSSYFPSFLLPITQIDTPDFSRDNGLYYRR